MIILIIALLSSIIIIWQISNIISIIYGVPYVTIDKKIIRKSLELSNLRKKEIFFDLGCGTGSVLIEAEKFKANVTGFEISPFYFLLAKIRLLKHPNVKVHYGNIFKVDLSKANVIYCYLIPNIIKSLENKFRNELKKGTRVISIGFPINILKNKSEYLIKDRKIYIYKI